MSHWRQAGPIWQEVHTHASLGFYGSLTLHALVIASMFIEPGQPREERSYEEAFRHATPLFIPAPELSRSAVQAARHTLLKTLSRTPKLQTETAPPNPEIRIDMNSIQLSFAEDVTNQLPDVVRSHSGLLALIDKEDPAFARYLIEPPHWNVRETLVDVTRKVRFAMYPPQKWALLRFLAQQHSISLDRYQACALFDSPYKQCLQGAIRTRARALSSGRNVNVQSARLVFAHASPCGVDVLEVSFAPTSSR